MTQVDFAQIYEHAERAAAAYSSDQDILEQYPDTLRVKTFENNDVKYFLEGDPKKQLYTLTVRGTSNAKNWVVDAEYVEIKDGTLGAHVHRGFDHATREIYEDVRGLLTEDWALQTTGHSLGAAIATLLLLYFDHDGREIEQCVNFGQPKVTNEKGVERFRSAPVLRIVDENDVVPLLPPHTLLDAVHGGYRHFGQEIILLRDQYYVELGEHRAEEVSVDSFWKGLLHESVKEHFMKNYLRNAASKRERSTPVPYESRERYVSDAAPGADST